MKLTIKSGESIENAINYLINFLEQYKEDYPILKGNMNVYLTLKGFGSRNCPDNEAEFILSETLPVDVEASSRMAKIKELTDTWKSFYNTHEAHRVMAARNVKKCINSLNQAIERGLTQRTIERRDDALVSSNKTLSKADEYFQFLTVLNDRIVKNEVQFYVVKNIGSRSSYDYTFTAYIIFENVEGKNYYFSAHTNKYKASCGELYNGLPECYK